MIDPSWLGHPFWIALVEVIGINIVLSGDNAVVIALACRSLPPRRRRWGVVLGAGAATVLRIALTIGVTYLMAMPFLNLAGGILLFWIAIKLIALEQDGESDNVESTTNLWAAIRMIAAADAVMSLDNVVSVAAAAKDDLAAIPIGLAISIPFVMFFSALIMKMMARFPLIIWAGGALLGWIAGDLMVADPAIAPWIEVNASWMKKGSPAAGAFAVIALGAIIRRGSRRGATKK